MTDSTPSDDRATLAGLCAVLLWGTALTFSRFASAQTGYILYCVTVFGCSGLFTLLYRWKRGRTLWVRPAFPLGSILCGLFFVGHQTCSPLAVFLMSRENIPVGVLLHYLWPTLTILGSIVFAGVRIHRSWAFALGTLTVIAALGVEFLRPGVGNSLKGDALGLSIALAGAFFWALYSSLSRRWGESVAGDVMLPYYQLSFVFLLPLLLFFPAEPNATSTLLVIVPYALTQFIAYSCWEYGMRRGNVVLVSLFADFIPWLSLLSFAVFLGVPIGVRTAVSAALLVGGALLTRYGLRAREVVE